ncbi:gametocyte-specific factor 1 isoform X2 [Calonectris borealis]|uniref:gametocyte-specific factor 1 isoform X2 n=1 Tax=Calonectris borealis TaxID=1323832 RepID=UPI003F4BC198
MATAERGGPRRPRRKPGPVAVATRRRARPVGNLLRRAAGPGSDLGPAMDPEALVQCPYDKSHQVRVSRLPYHLVKCQRNNPQVARTLATCPFNARHRVPQAKLRSHVASCPDKLQPDLPHETDTSLGNRMKQPEVPTAWQGPPCQEDWEAELEDLEDPPPFIFNVRTNDLLLPCDSSAPAAPTSRSRGGGVAGCPAVGAEQRAQERPGHRTVAAGPGQCPSLHHDQGDRSAGGGTAPSTAAVGGDCTHRF